MIIKLASPSGIEIKKSHKGLLHKDLGISENEPITIERIKQELAKKPDLAKKRRLIFALNAKTKFKKN